MNKHLETLLCFFVAFIIVVAISLAVCFAFGDMR